MASSKKKPQLRTITSEKRIMDIRNAMLRLMVEHIGFGGKELPEGSYRMYFAKCLTGLEESGIGLTLVERTIATELPEYISAIHKAFVYAYESVNDAEFVVVGKLPGCSMGFFKPLLDEHKTKKEQNRSESQRNRRPSAAHKAQSGFAQRLIDAGYAKPHQMPVDGKEGAQRVLSAAKS